MIYQKSVHHTGAYHHKKCHHRDRRRIFLFFQQIKQYDKCCRYEIDQICIHGMIHSARLADVSYHLVKRAAPFIHK